MEKALETAKSAFDDLRSLPTGALADLYAPVRTDSPLSAIVDQWAEMEASDDRWTVLVDRTSKRIERLEGIDDRRSRFVRTEQSCTLGQIQGFDGRTFEGLVAWLADRDSMEVKQKQGGQERSWRGRHRPDAGWPKGGRAVQALK